MKDEFIWSEEFRPRKIADCILPSSLKANFQDIVEKKNFQHMIFTGTAGLGKTTVARALCEEMGLDYIIINGSGDGNIDTLRGKIKQFASTMSLSEGFKVVIIDEADGLNPQSFQPALRGFMQEYAKNCRFILTCNYKNKLIEPIHSRCSIYEFNTNKKQMAVLAGQFFERAKEILVAKNIKYHDKAVAELIVKFAPDWRSIINSLQRYSSSGVIDSGVLEDLSDTSFDKLISVLREKDFKGMRNWVVNNLDADPAIIFRGVYDRMNKIAKPTSIPALILILAEYQYKSAFVADHELNVAACLTEIMSNVEFL